MTYFDERAKIKKKIGDAEKSFPVFLMSAQKE